MATSQIEPERITELNDAESSSSGRYVLYWMHASMRAEDNPALEYAIQRANEHEVPVVVACTVIADYPDASPRHLAFLLAGMGEALRGVERRGGTTVVRRTAEPPTVVVELAQRAVEVVVDRGYLRHQRRWCSAVGADAPCQVTRVESDVVVPIGLVSSKQEFAARTIRPKINRLREDFVIDLRTTSIENRRSVRVASDVQLAEFGDVASLLTRLELDRDGAPQPVDWITPGTSAAKARFRAFAERVNDYDDDRNRFTLDRTSLMSPYLHFGQISPVWIAHQLTGRRSNGVSSYLEELIVRRELASNFVEHCADYDSYSGLPEWAQATLDDHRDDDRESIHTATELANASTSDEVWNAIMRDVRDHGWVHNQLRMYWGKQIVRWTNTPEHAYRTLLKLNNTYFLDGRDPSSYANVGWCFGLHDQGFREREVSGKVRPFTTAALKRKDDLSGWVDDRRDR